MSMTKRHYVAIADAIACTSEIIDLFPNEPIYDLGTTQNAIGSIAKHIADIVERDNPRFDRDLFLEACRLRNVRL
jgi:nucleoside-diphosphate-sugar epimerase